VAPGPPGRAVIRCPNCRLVQYLSSTRSRCPRCFALLSAPVAAPAPLPQPVAARPDVAAGVRSWRRTRGFTQKQLAVASQLPRTYISRIENGRIIPGLLTLERVATALEVGLPALLVASPCGPYRGGSGPGNSNGNGNGGGNGQTRSNGNGPTYPIVWPQDRASGGWEPDSCLRELLRYSGVLTGGQRRQVLVRVRELAAPRLPMSH
jgi:transcriptional regulator with XRE-family HTH domain